MRPIDSGLPWGIIFLQYLKRHCCPFWHMLPNRQTWYKVQVMVLTYIAYTCYHMSRKPISVVKNVLNQNCSELVPPAGMVLTNSTAKTWCDWAPFDGPNADTLLGALDSSFLFAYAFGMFFSGMVAERVNLRYFLTLGMLLSSVFSYLFGLAFSINIHSIYYFFLVQILGGLCQTTGWPGVVTVMGNWYGKGKRGLIFGIWNSHTSVGNILGSILAGIYVEYNWGLSFIVPAGIMGGVGFILFLFLVPKPIEVGCLPPDYVGNKPEDLEYDVNVNGYSPVNRRITRYMDDYDSDYDSTETLLHRNEKTPDEDTPIFQSQVMNSGQDEKAISFWGAVQIPGVIEYSLCLFFAKLVSYTFLYWLPKYISYSTTFSATQSADLSTLFDVGGIVGGIVAGVLSDYTGMSATTCVGMLIVSIPMLFVYDTFGADDLATNIGLLIVVGLLVTGPYALITTAVSAELGTHPSLQGNSKALATVTAIIDGTGSIGAAVGPLMAGAVSNRNWNYVFYILMICDILALLLLTRLVVQECRRTLPILQRKVSKLCEPSVTA